MTVSPVLRLLRNRSGGAAIEFAMIAPVLFGILFGIIQFSLFFNNVSVLTNATAAGALLFSQGRSFSAPYSSAVTAIQNTAATLTKANLNISMSVNGTACATDTSCQTALGAGGVPATVTVSYPCPLVFSPTTLQWIGFDASKICPLSASMTAVVQ
jgi:Flp pilus assembly protein TadG